MAYTVDWIAKTISIPVSDLTLVSGTWYRLSMVDFLIEIRRLEASPVDGLWAIEILDHTNPQIDFAGADYYGFDKIVNGYSVQFEPPATRVDLIGSNNNIADVLIVNGISVVPSNTAGGQRITAGSGVTAQDKIDIAALSATDVWSAASALGLLSDVEFIKDVEGGKWEIVGNQMVFYKADNTTEVARFSLNNASSPTVRSRI